MENFFYLVDISKTRLPSGITFDILWLGVLVLFLLYHSNFRNASCVGFIFKKEILLALVMIIISAIRSYLLVGQSIFLGFSPQRNLIVLFLAYFVLRKMFANKRVNEKLMWKWIIFFGIITVLLLVLQVTVFKNIRYIHSMEYERYESVRLYVDCVLAPFIGIYGAAEFYEVGNKKYLILCVLAFLYELLVSKGRLELVSLILAICIGAFFIKKMSKKKLLIYVLICVGIVCFLNSKYFDSILYAVQNVQEDNMSIRLEAHAFYLSRLFESPLNFLLGCGYPNTKYRPSVLYAGTNKFNAVDNGFFAIYFIYGLFGLILLIFTTIKLIKISYSIMIRHQKYIYFMFFIFQVFMSYNITFWWWKADWLLIDILLMISMESICEAKI